MVREWSAGRMVVNLFSYTGGFSVAAALGGAVRVVTVDIAPDAIDDARENFRLNGLDPDPHGFEVADAFHWTPRDAASGQGRRFGPFGLVVVDPPSLAHDKQADAAARRAYRKLHAHVGSLVSRDGLLATSSCTARLDVEGWRRAVVEGLAERGEWSWHTQSAEPVDHPIALGHPEGRYLKFALLRRRSAAVASSG
jgi:23S rRNA (cytosine1962-C5)-methyltransferase